MTKGDWKPNLIMRKPAKVNVVDFVTTPCSSGVILADPKIAETQ